VKRWLLAFLLAAALLTGCSRATTESGQPTPTATFFAPTANRWPTAADIPSPTVTSAPPPCDPLSEDFCIVAGHFVLQRPISPEGNDFIDPTYRYGGTQGETREPHHGVEFPNPQGTPVLAAAAGTVLFAGDDAVTLLGPLTGFYGNVIVLEHHLEGIEAPLFTLYAHLSRIDVSVGQTVTAGETIGAVGLTGIAVGSHLHFEVRLGTNDYRSTRNPELWLAPRLDASGQPYGALALRVADGYGNLLPVFPVLQYYPDRASDPTWETQLEPYPRETLNSDDVWGENFALGSLTPGWYRISFVQMGGLYERWVEIQAGKLTVTIFQIIP
jgi:murein DD-endopeptidase MepM/ murein hydrolase activator NlpD